MSVAYQYVRVIFYNQFDGKLPNANGFVRKSQLLSEIESAAASYCSQYAPKFDYDFAGFASTIFDELSEMGLIAFEEDDLAGAYYRLVAAKFSGPREVVPKESPIMARARRIPSLFQDALRSYQRSLDEGVIEPERATDVPASDRIVTLDHNQVAALETPVSELIQELERDNGDPDEPGLRERLIGQIKAGRELLRAGEFRAYLLYETLVRALGELIRRYSNPTITALANALLGAIVSEFFQS